MSSGLGDVFGRRPLRPAHPDFWRMSEIFLGMDAGFDESVPDEVKEQMWAERVDAVVDRDSLIYMAAQRAMRLVGVPRTLEQARQHATTAALVADAFVAGIKFQQAGGHQAKPGDSFRRKD